MLVEIINMKYLDTVEVREQVMSWGATWTRTLEKWVSDSGKTVKYYIYHQGGQSYPVAEFASLRKALKAMNEMTFYNRVYPTGA